MHFALRRMRVHFADPRVLAAMGGAALILGFSGPFGTYAYLSVVPRLIYWAAVVVATYGLGSAIGMIAGEPVRQRIRNPGLRALVYGLLIGPAVTVAVLLINVATFGAGGLSAIGWLELVFYCSLIAAVVSAISEMIGAALQRPVAAVAAQPVPPPILERLPLPQRGKLLALSVSDHYVEVSTERGKGLVLMRLADAMRETGDLPGVQIHRSHWVALDAVTRVFRSGGKPMVELSNGVTLPISRGFLPAAREAGLVV